MNYVYNILIFICIYIILSGSLNILVGYTGLLSLAHAGFYAIGAYTSVLLHQSLGINPFASMTGGIVLTALLSFGIAYPSLRLKGDYFVLASLGFQIIAFSILYNWVDLTRGPYGISGITQPKIFGISISSLPAFFIFSFIVASIVVLLLYKILHSPFGLVLKAIREDDVSALALGKNVTKFKIQAFIISASIASIAGSLYAWYVSYIDPTSFTLDESIFILAIVLVGGSGNLRGPIIGAVLMILLPEILRFTGIPDSIAPNLRQMIYGLLLIVLMFYRPQGIAGEYKLE